MSQIFDKDGRPVPVTVISAGPCYVTAVKTKEKDGYLAVQLGYEKTKKLNKPEEGHLKKVQDKLKLKNLREFRVKNAEEIKEIKPGDEISVAVFKEGDRVKITGISKGKGFAGVIKRHGFARGPETHGSDHHRRPGSIGSMFPQRVLKGKKMPGHLGVQQVTLKNAQIVKVLPESQILMIKGAIPGPNKGLIKIQGQ